MNKRTLIIAVLAVALSGCSYLPSWMGGKKEEKPRLPGERVAVLPVNAGLTPDETVKNAAFSLPPPTPNGDWPQHNGVDTSAAGNLEAAGNFTHVTSARIGNGEEFDHTLIPRPVVGGGLVFAMDAVGNLSAHDAANIGNVKWTSKGVSDEDEPEIMGGGLAYDDGKLYVTSGRGRVSAFDAATGKELWHKGVLIPFQSAPRIENGRLFAITVDNQVYAFNAATGDVLWSQRGIGETAALLNSVTPAISGDTVIVPYSSGEVYALGQADGHEVWNESLLLSQRTQAGGIFAGIGGDPLVDGDMLYAVSSGGLFTVFFAANGKHSWEAQVGAINTPWIAGDYIYLLTTDNTLVCFFKYDGRIRWSTKLRDWGNQKEKKDPISWKGPVMVSGRLAVVGSDGELLLVNAGDGQMTAQSIPENIYTAPVVAGGRIYLIGQDAELYTLQ